MNTRQIVASRLKQLRINKEMTQKEICSDPKLLTMLGRSKSIPVANLSSWEIGSKAPKYSVISVLADYFGVSSDYLLGRTDDHEVIQTNDIELHEIPFKELSLYDERPVYIKIPNNIAKDRWGIYNAKKKCFYCADSILKQSDRLAYYSAKIPLPL